MPDVTVQALRPWRLFLGRVPGTHEPALADAVDAADLAGRHRFAFASPAEVVVFVVGPRCGGADERAPVSNLRVCWAGVEPGALRLVVLRAQQVQQQRGSELPQDTLWRDMDGPPLASVAVGVMDAAALPGSAHGWAHASVPLVSAGWPPAPGYRGPWTALEVHTRVPVDASRVQQRLEHHSAGRVPPAGCWQTRGGYAVVPPATLAAQAQAAVAWQFAARAVLVATGWAAALPAVTGEPDARVSLMGFETNNPLHDDHSGRGAHWHVAVRGALGNPTPHLYVRADGTLDAALEGKGRSWDLGSFGLHYADDGGLDFGAVVAVRHVNSRLFLHVRASLQNDRDPVAAFTDPAADGNRWLLLRGAENRVALVSTRSGRCLHVRLGMRDAPEGVVQFGACDEGSWWRAESPAAAAAAAAAAGGAGSNGRVFVMLRNERSGQYLRLPDHPADRTPAQQGRAADTLWEIVPAHAAGTQGAVAAAGAPAIALCSMHVTVRADPAGAGAEALLARNGARWRRLRVVDRAEEGLLRVVTEALDGGELLGADGPAERTIRYHPLTGAQV